MLIIASYGCKSTANVSCVNVQKFQSNFGVLNSNMFENGDVIVIDTLNKNGIRILSIPMNSSEIASYSPVDTFEILTETGFEIQLTGKIAKKGSSTVQAQAKTRISKETTFLLSNAIRKNVKNPQKILTSNSLIRSQIIQNLKDNPNNIIFMVSGIVYADNFDFRIKRSSEYQGQANVMKVGNFKLDVNYNCSGSLRIQAEQGGVFYKLTLFKLIDDRLAAFNPTINIAEYKFIITN
jgi:vacuolar-type H+-ATPase subunit E/Vma4